MVKKISVVEVGPRDGFQSVKCAMISTEKKIEIIEKLIAAGVKHIEYTSFVSPKAIPQLADAAEVTNEASFTADLGADSLDTVELIMEFEKEFNIQIPEEAAEKIGTVGDAISHIEAATK